MPPGGQVAASTTRCTPTQSPKVYTALERLAGSSRGDLGVPQGDVLFLAAKESSGRNKRQTYLPGAWFHGLGAPHCL